MIKRASTTFNKTKTHLTFPERVAGGSTTASLGALVAEVACTDEVLDLSLEEELLLVATTSSSSSSVATELALERVLRATYH